MGKMSKDKSAAGKKAETKQPETPAAETKKGPIGKKEGPKGLGVGEAIIAILKASKKKGGMTVAEVQDKMEAVYGERKDATVSAQLSAKNPTRITMDNLNKSGVIIEMIEGKDAASRTYVHAGVATDEQKAEWKSAKKETKAAKKAAKVPPATEPANMPDASKYQDNDTENPETEETAEEKAARKAAKKAKKAAKKAAKAGK